METSEPQLMQVPSISREVYNEPQFDNGLYYIMNQETLDCDFEQELYGHLVSVIDDLRRSKLAHMKMSYNKLNIDSLV